MVGKPRDDVVKPSPQTWPHLLQRSRTRVLLCVGLEGIGSHDDCSSSVIPDSQSYNLLVTPLRRLVGEHLQDARAPC